MGFNAATNIEVTKGLLIEVEHITSIVKLPMKQKKEDICIHLLKPPSTLLQTGLGQESKQISHALQKQKTKTEDISHI